MRKSFAPVRPADAAARDAAGAQVHAFDARRVHEQLEHRPREREVGDLRGIELEDDARTGPAVVAGLVPVRAQRREHEPEERAQDAVFVEARDRVDLLGDLGHERVGGGVLGRARPLANPRRVEAGAEQPDQAAREQRVRGERVGDVGLAERRTDLAEVAAVRAQQRDLAPRRGRRAGRGG